MTNKVQNLYWLTNFYHRIVYTGISPNPTINLGSQSFWKMHPWSISMNI